MIRWGLRLLTLAVLLFAVGFAGAWSVWFEVARLAGTGCLALGLALLLIDHLFASPEPSPPVLGDEGSDCATKDPLTPNPSPPSTGARGTGSG